MIVKAKIISEVDTTQYKPKRIWDNYEEIGFVQKSDKIRTVVAAAVRDGVRYLNIREFYFRAADESWRPGRDGITIPLAVPIEKGTKIIEPYTDLIYLLNKAMHIAKDMELADEDNAVYYMKEVK